MAKRRQRLHQLLNRIRVQQQTTIDDLAKFFHVSTATIRRDIKTLEAEEAIVQTVGGGVMYQLEATGALDRRQSSQSVEEKIRIAEFCTELVHDHDDILIGPGTTTFLIGKILSGITDRNFRVITNSLELASEMSSAANIRTLLLGGEVWNKYTIPPDVGYDYFARCHHDHTLVFSGDGFDVSFGVSIFETRMVSVLRDMLKVSSRIILALDSSKVGKARFNMVATLDDIDLLVTDRGAPDDFVRQVRAKGVKVEIV
ncbi:MAG: DeoR/GlpR transcriptional regulator [Spirochaetaceae bacterium]|nr:MAG: DeoR/GlpR transcriptional regulator [Spirochaetaceae bacterium]